LCVTVTDNRNACLPVGRGFVTVTFTPEPTKGSNHILSIQS
jgi:hypothetical protein